MKEEADHEVAFTLELRAVGGGQVGAGQEALDRVVVIAEGA